jgi:D-xylulose reductase
MVLGHESAGLIHATGSAVTSLQVGDRVTMEPGIPCRRCARCKEGRYNLCPDMAFAATPPYDGTLARFYRLPEDFCYRLPEHLSLEEGALMEPASVAVHVCRQAGAALGKSLVVFGAGPVGLLCCAVAKAFGAKKIIGIDISEERVRFAEKYAATGVFRPSKDDSPEQSAKRLIAEHDLGAGADAVIDASGAAVCIQTGIHALRTGGTYCQAGMVCRWLFRASQLALTYIQGAADVSFPIMAMCSKELTVKGSFRYGPDDYRLAVELAASGRLQVKELISHKFDFKNAEEAFQSFKAGKGIKILIQGPTE